MSIVKVSQKNNRRPRELQIEIVSMGLTWYPYIEKNEQTRICSNVQVNNTYQRKIQLIRMNYQIFYQQLKIDYFYQKYAHNQFGLIFLPLNLILQKWNYFSYFMLKQIIRFLSITFNF
ncbi:hypothetical protein pb186bvf_003028 [Paramecium bursaria]